MCYHRWFPVTPKGCTASNPHSIMRKETIFCNEAIDRSLQQSEVDHNEQSAQKKVGTLGRGGSVMFLACVDEAVKVMDSFNRIIQEEPIQALNTHCPCCAGEMTMANALLVTTQVSDNVPAVIERTKRNETDNCILIRQTPNTYPPMPCFQMAVSFVSQTPQNHWRSICGKPLEESITKPKPAEKLVMTPFVEELKHEIEDWDSNMTRFPLPPIPRELKDNKLASKPFGVPEHCEEYRKWAIIQNSKIWQLSSNGIISGMLIPVCYAVYTSKAMDPDECDCDNTMLVYGRVNSG